MLFNSHGTQLPFGLGILPSELGEQASPVLWYIASSPQKSDIFFSDGGGFGTFYVNRVLFPASGSGQQLTLNVEHSRPVTYSVNVTRTDVELDSAADFPIPIITTASLDPLNGVLSGNDDIIGTGPDGDPQMVFANTANIQTVKFDVGVLLDDTNLLTPKHQWIRTFTFTAPGTQEP